MISTTFDHAVITVADLDRAIAEFSDFGFHVTPGGAHGRTAMAMVIFQDGTYIELIALQSGVLRGLLRLAGKTGLLRRILAKKPDVYRRLIAWFGSLQGPMDWCIRVEDLNEAVERWRQLGITCLQSGAFHRTCPDGQTAKWLLGSPTSTVLPFAIEDLTDIRIRVPADPSSRHPNGALGIRSIRIAVANEQAARREFATAFQTNRIADRGCFRLGQTVIQLSENVRSNAKFELELTCDGQECTLVAANARINLVNA
jgi:hypothetical protein